MLTHNMLECVLFNILNCSAMIKITSQLRCSSKGKQGGGEKNSLLLLSNSAQQLGIIKSSLVPQK